MEPGESAVASKAFNRRDTVGGRSRLFGACLVAVADAC